jgi:probable selenium-dependent hydroxylase accessory protein YqeC
MKLLDTLLSLSPISPQPENRRKHGLLISLVGAGGKTTTIYALAKSAAEQGMRVLISTTTMMMDPRSDPIAQYDRFYLGPLLPENLPAGTEEPGQIHFAASETVEEVSKVRGLSGEKLTEISKNYDLILIEADGANHRPVKAPGPHEPVIPKDTDLLIGIIGLDCLGKPMDARTVHRPELFAKITGLAGGEVIGPEQLIKLINSPTGLFKGAPEGIEKIVLLNKSDLQERKAQFLSYLETIPTPSPARIFFSSMQMEDFLEEIPLSYSLNNGFLL